MHAKAQLGVSKASEIWYFMSRALSWNF